MNSLENYVYKKLGADTSGHSYLHAKRVEANALLIQKEEGGDIRIVEAASLLHDTVDPKLFSDTEKAKKELLSFLKEERYSEKEIKDITYIIDNLSWHIEVKHPGPLETLEGNIVRDADRLEAIGAIGTIRAIEYGASRGREFWTEEEMNLFSSGKPINPKDNTTLAHFYDKLLLLESHFVTKTGQKLAKKRSQFLIDFLRELKEETPNQ